MKSGLVRRTVRSVVAVATIGLSTLVLGVTPTNAQQALPQPEIVEATLFIGEDNKSVALVSVSSPLPTKGELRLGGSFVENSPSSTTIELPTGGDKSVWLPMPAGGNSFSSNSVTWDVASGKDPEFSFNRVTNAVAVLPSALGSRKAPNTVSSIGRTGSAQFAALTLDDIEQRGWILTGFHTLATTSREVGSLSPAGQQLILGWVERGGELLVDDDSNIPGLKTQPQPNKSLVLGAGAIRRTGNAMRTGQWESILLPSMRWKPENYSGPFEEPTIGVSLRDSIKLAPVGPLLGALTFYSLLLGPVVYLVSKKKNKPMLLWVAIPLVSLLTTSVVVGIGTALRRTARDQLVVATLHGETANSVLVVRAITEGSSARKVKLAPGWTAHSADTNFSISTGSSMTTKLSLLPGQVSEVRFQGTTAPTAAPFTAEMTAPGQVRVTNVSNAPLVNVAIVSGKDSFSRQYATVKNLAAGKSAVLSLSPLTQTNITDKNNAQIADQLVTSNISLLAIAEAATSSTKGVPSTLASGAKLLPGRHLVNVTQQAPVVAMGFANPGSTDAEAIYRIDFGDKNPSDYTVDMLDGEVWVEVEYVPIGDRRIPPTAAMNGIVLLRGSTAPTLSADAPVVFGE